LCSRKPSITAANNAWGGFSLGRDVMECRKEAAQMMVRHGAVLMRGGGRKEGGKRTKGGGELIAARGSKRMNRQCRCETCREL